MIYYGRDGNDKEQYVQERVAKKRVSRHLLEFEGQGEVVSFIVCFGVTEILCSKFMYFKTNWVIWYNDCVENLNISEFPVCILSVKYLLKYFTKSNNSLYYLPIMVVFVKDRTELYGKIQYK